MGSVDQTFIGELRFDTTQVTNAGSVSFNFSEYYKQGQAGFAVLDIEATKGRTGIGIIKIEEEMTNEQTVIMGEPLPDVRSGKLPIFALRFGELGM